MADTPVTDSYITTIELAETYFANDPRAAAWLLLSDALKAWYLQRATKAIDALPLRGRKFDRDGTQDRQFPREYRDGYDQNELSGEAEVPQAVEDACCEEALAIYSQGTSGRIALQEQGVQSFSIGGKLSETFRPGASNIHYGLKSADAYRLLAKYIARSFPIL